MFSRGVDDRRISRLPPQPECFLLLGTAITADQSKGNSHTPSVVPQRLQIRDHRSCDANTAVGNKGCSQRGDPDRSELLSRESCRTIHYPSRRSVGRELAGLFEFCEFVVAFRLSHPRKALKSAIASVIQPATSWGNISASLTLRKPPETDLRRTRPPPARQLRLPRPRNPRS